MIETAQQRWTMETAAVPLPAVTPVSQVCARGSVLGRLGAVSLAVLLLVQFDSARAQAPPKAQPGTRTKAAPADSAAAQTANDQAQKLLQAGNAQGAVNILSGAISGGKLPPPVMARALYLRGVSHRKLQKPAQAISDLTSALWLKGGLSAEDRADANQQRSAAYAEAGLAEPGQNTVEAKAVPAPSPAAPAAAQAATATPRAPSKRVAAATDAAPAVNQPRAAQASVVAQASAPAADTKNEWSGRGGKRIEPPTPPPSESAFPAFPPAGNSQPSPGTGSLFGGLFGNSAPAEKAPEPKVDVPPQPAPAAVPVAPAPPPQRAAVSARQKVATAPVKAAAVRPDPAQPSPGPAAGAASDPGGTFHARVALVRSKAEADTILARVKSQYGQAVGSRTVAVDQSSFGNMGTFFQVKIVGYASVRDAQAACDKLKGSGLDCVPVNR